ncbi:GTP cyclohydrolase I FolE [Colwelliaceae bacterium BS250]
MINSQQGLSESAIIVQKALLSAGLETPTNNVNALSNAEKYNRIKAAFTEITTVLGLDLNDDSLEETPHRIAKMYINEIFSGLDYQNFPKITVIENKMDNDEMIIVKDINLTSTCEHHFVTIDGLAKVAYIPNKKIIGLSKINRLVRFFAQRPQVQERLTQQVLISLKALLATEHVAVTMNAVHYCVKARGVMDSNSSTTTTALSGCFKSNAATRSEFLQN